MRKHLVPDLVRRKRGPDGFHFFREGRRRRSYVHLPKFLLGHESFDFLEALRVNLVIGKQAGPDEEEDQRDC